MIFLINLLFKKKLYRLKWEDSVRKKYTDTVRLFHVAIGKFFHSVQGENLSALFEKVDMRFRSDFVSVLAEYKVTNRVSNDQFSDFIANSPQAMQFIICEKKLVLKYGQVKTNTKSNHQINANRWDCVFYRQDMEVDVKLHIIVFDLYVDESLPIK